MLLLEQTEILLYFLGVLIPLCLFFFSFTNRITALETKLNCLLEWEICLEPGEDKDVHATKSERKRLKKEIEKHLNGDRCIHCEEDLK